jgi:hypothetical protein
LGILFLRLCHNTGSKKPEDVSCRERKRGRLVFVKNKLEKHRERLDRHLRHINARIETVGVGKTAMD